MNNSLHGLTGTPHNVSTTGRNARTKRDYGTSEACPTTGGMAGITKGKFAGACGNGDKDYPSRKSGNTFPRPPVNKSTSGGGARTQREYGK